MPDEQEREAIITLPDGRRARLTGTEQQISQASDELMGATPAAGYSHRDPRSKEIDFGAIGLGAATSYLDSLIGLANLGFTAGSRFLLNLPMKDREVPINSLDPKTVERLNTPILDLPEVGDRPLPLPEAINVVPGASEAQQRSPLSFGAGETAGDIATLITGRAPITRILARRPSVAAQITEKEVADVLEALARANPSLAPRVVELIGEGRLATPGATRLWSRMIDSPASKSMRRGLGKAAEAGLEGAFLAVLKEGDPMQMAALSAGGQALTSLGGTFFGLPSNMKGLALRAVAYTTLLRLGQEFSPGDNTIYTAIDSSFSKLALGLSVGAASQLVGGRFRGSAFANKFSEDLPMLSDAINTIPRGALMSVANRITAESKAGDSTTLAVIETLQSNPGAFGPEIAERIDQALQGGTIGREIDRLMTDPAFRRQIDDIQAVD